MITPLLVPQDIFDEVDFLYANIRGLANPYIHYGMDAHIDLLWSTIAEALDKYYIYDGIKSNLFANSYLSHIS